MAGEPRRPPHPHPSEDRGGLVQVGDPRSLRSEEAKGTDSVAAAAARAAAAAS